MRIIYQMDNHRRNMEQSVLWRVDNHWLLKKWAFCSCLLAFIACLYSTVIIVPDNTHHLGFRKFNPNWLKQRKTLKITKFFFIPQCLEVFFLINASIFLQMLVQNVQVSHMLIYTEEGYNMKFDMHIEQKIITKGKRPNC